MDRGGLVGADGATHGGAFDITYMACLPNMVVMAPSNEAELIHMVATAAAIDDRPSCFRYDLSAFNRFLRDKYPLHTIRSPSVLCWRACRFETSLLSSGESLNGQTAVDLVILQCHSRVYELLAQQSTFSAGSQEATALAWTWPRKASARISRGPLLRYSS